MVTQEQIETNIPKLIELKDLLDLMLQKHGTALFTYRVGEEDKVLPPDDIDVLVEDYRALKVQCQDKFKELL